MVFRSAALAAASAAISLAACGGEGDSGESTAVIEGCAIEVCGTPGTALTAQMMAFDHASDLLEVAIGTSAVAFAVTPTTQPLLAEPCGDTGAVGQVIVQWNATAPMNPFGQFDAMDDEDRGGKGSGPYHRLLAKLAKLGATALITVQHDSMSVATVKPVCPTSE